MDVGDLVWIVGRPSDGWVKTLGIIVNIHSAWVYVSPIENPKATHKLLPSDLERFEK